MQEKRNGPYLLLSDNLTIKIRLLPNVFGGDNEGKH